MSFKQILLVLDKLKTPFKIDKIPYVFDISQNFGFGFFICEKKRVRVNTLTLDFILLEYQR